MIWKIDDKGKAPSIPGNYLDFITPLKSAGANFDARVLDIGCNSAWMAKFFSDYWGADTDRELVKYAREYWTRNGRWSFEEAEKRILHTEGSIPFQGNQFDLIIMRDVLEHVENPLPFFESAVELLKPNGYIFLSSPDSQRWVWNDPSHKRPYPRSSMRWLCDSHNLKWVKGFYESVAPGTQLIARKFGGRSPFFVSICSHLFFWPRNSAAILQKRF